MEQNQSVLGVRIFAVILLALALYLMWVPSLSSLQKAEGTVSSVTVSLKKANADFTLASGEVLHCAGRGYQMCPADKLSALSSTKETVTIWHKDGKVWQVETAGKQKTVDHATIRLTRFLIMGLVLAVFGGIAVFAPRLVK